MTAWFPVLVVFALAPLQCSDELAPPLRLMAGGKPLDVEGTGHAAPFYADLDGSGRKSLLVGQFDGGKLRIYHNRGTPQEPKFDDFTWFLDGKPEGTVPCG
jgi:hypothetical protein